MNRQSGAQPFRFGGYTFPIPPSRFEVRDGLELQPVLAPLIGTFQRPLGRAAREVSGEGSFFGEDALADYRALQTVFLAGKTAQLSVPGIRPFDAYFAELAMAGQAGPQLVRYSFRFVEADTGEGEDGTAVYTTRGGETIWELASRLGVSADQLAAWNPGMGWQALPAGVQIRLEGGMGNDGDGRD